MKRNQNHKPSDFNPLLYVGEMLQWSEGLSKFTEFSLPVQGFEAPSSCVGPLLGWIIVKNHVVNIKNNDATVPNGFSWPQQTSLTSSVVKLYHGKKLWLVPDLFYLSQPSRASLNSKCIESTTDCKTISQGDEGRWALVLKQLNPCNRKEFDRS